MNASMLFSSLLAGVLIDSLWLTALIALACGLAFELLRHARPATRHAVGMLAMLAMAGAPLALGLWRVVAAGHGATLAPSTGAANLVDQVQAFGSSVPDGGFVAQQMHEWMSVCIAQCWLFGVMLMLALQLRGWWQVRQLRATSFGVVPDYWQHRFDGLRRQLGIAREVVLRAHDGMGSPFTAFAWRPLVWLPLAWLAQLPPEQIEMLLAHELAHIKRLDWIWNALQCLVEAVLFFHPAMWWVSGRVRHERELACDELAVSAGGDAIALAQALHSMQRRVSFTPRVVLNAEGGMLVKRIRYLLSGAPTPTLLRNSWPVLGGLALLLCSGTLAALELKPPHHVVINMMTSGNDGELAAPGDYRDVTVDLLSGKTLVYHASMDKTGHLVESFAEDGKPAKLEDDTRDWLRGLAVQAEKPSKPPLPPLPPLPPAPPFLAAAPGSAAPAAPAAPAVPAAPAAPAAAADEAVPAASPLPAPAAPPAPPKPPELTDSAAFHAMQADVDGSSAAQAIAGQPMHLIADSVHGEIHQWSAWDFHLYGIEPSPGGRARLQAVFEGPKGRVRVAYLGEVREGVWTTKKLDASPAAG